MGTKRKRKSKTHVPITEEEMKKYPRSFVMRSGVVGKSVADLVKDVRRIMEPHTATHLRERRHNHLRDFVSVAGPLGVTHFLIFSQTEENVQFRIARVPRGPTLTFRVHEYSLIKDCLALQRSPKSPGSEYRQNPLLVLNNFKQSGKEFQVMTVMLQGLFPSIDVQKIKLSDSKRVLLFNYNEDTKKIDVRQYTIGVKVTGVSKSIKRIINTDIPDLSAFDDISDYVLREAIVSESDVEDDAEANVTLPQDFKRGKHRKNDERAVRLYEIGPRMTLELIKIENGLCDGEVLYHAHKTGSEKAAAKGSKPKSKPKPKPSASTSSTASNNAAIARKPRPPMKKKFKVTKSA